MIDLLHYTFMQRAIVVATLTGGLCAIIGVYVILRGMSFIGAGIAHASFGGVALGFLTGLNPFFSAIIFCTGIAWGIGFISEKKHLKEDTAVGIFFASTMALGVLLIGFIKGYNVDLFAYIFGNVLAITKFDMWATILLSLFVVASIVFLYKEFLFLTFDSEMAQVTGLPVRFLNYLMLTLIALVIVISIKAVGIVLVSALIVAPAAAAQQISENFKKMLIISVMLGIGSSWIGLFLSSLLNIPSGATIVLVATIIFFILYIYAQTKRYRTQKKL